MRGDTASMLWYNVGEVGASSSGSAGLEMTESKSIAPSSTASAYQFNGHSISIPAGAGTFPDDWESGLVIRVQLVAFLAQFSLALSGDWVLLVNDFLVHGGLLAGGSGDPKAAVSITW